MLDTNAMLILSTADVTATVTGTSRNLGADLVPATWMIYVPSIAGTAPTLTVTIEESPDGSTGWVVISTRAITAAGVFFETVVSNLRHRRAVLTVGGTTPNFGRVIVGRVPAGHYTNF